jgi:hypothetical protein
MTDDEPRRERWDGVAPALGVQSPQDRDEGDVLLRVLGRCGPEPGIVPRPGHAQLFAHGRHRVDLGFGSVRDGSEFHCFPLANQVAAFLANSTCIRSSARVASASSYLSCRVRQPAPYPPNRERSCVLSPSPRAWTATSGATPIAASAPPPSLPWPAGTSYSRTGASAACSPDLGPLARPAHPDPGRLPALQVSAGGTARNNQRPAAVSCSRRAGRLASIFHRAIVDRGVSGAGAFGG